MKLVQIISEVIPLPRSGNLSLAVSFRARETGARLKRVASATNETMIQSSLKRRARLRLTVTPALKSRAEVMRRYAAELSTASG